LAGGLMRIFAERSEIMTGEGFRPDIRRPKSNQVAS
jgi:hypothetical protein